MPSRYGLDPITELGCRLKQPIPTGEDFEEWAFSVKGPTKTPYAGMKGIQLVVKALRDAGYEEREIQFAFASASRQRWAPSADALAGMT